MDGLQTNEDIILILTTNAIDRIEAAIRDRPGRISQAVHFGPAHRRTAAPLLGARAPRVEHPSGRPRSTDGHDRGIDASVSDRVGQSSRSSSASKRRDTTPTKRCCPRRTSSRHFERCVGSARPTRSSAFKRRRPGRQLAAQPTRPGTALPSKKRELVGPRSSPPDRPRPARESQAAARV